jgi:hypothetical protein
LPFSGTDQKEIEKKVISQEPERIDSCYEQHLEDFLYSLLQKNPNQRHLLTDALAFPNI